MVKKRFLDLRFCVWPALLLRSGKRLQGTYSLIREAATLT